MRIAIFGLTAASTALFSVDQATAQELAGSASKSSEIVVTAQKRQQSINDVPLTIVAATGDQLQRRGITSVLDLPRLVPGFTVQESSFNSVSFTMRGVGFFNSDLSTPPTVSVYVDQAPLLYPALTRLAAFDLERVEVLKGPQGTLFGQNSTGGAINYIAAKPTSTLEIGGDLSYARFNTIEASAFISGPLSNTLRARIAVRGTRGDPWQRSITRSSDKLGRVRELAGRVILDWQPVDALQTLLTLEASHDGSDTLAPQAIAAFPNIPGLESPALANYLTADSTREADWKPGQDYAKDNDTYRASLRNDLDISDGLTVTSLTSYVNFKTSYFQDMDGTVLRLLDVTDLKGTIETFSQELRLAGRSERLNWLIGTNYDHARIKDNPLSDFGDFSGAHAFEPAFGIASDFASLRSDYKVKTYAAFFNAEFAVTDVLRLQGAIRYTNDKRRYSGCTYDVGGRTAAVLNAFQIIINNGGAIVPIPPGGCVVLDDDNGYRPIDLVRKTLHEDNISWKMGANWRPSPRLLLYATVSKGYKAGTVPVIGAAIVKAYDPISQETVLVYESGVKATLFDRKVQVNAAAFYYDYKDKQLRGKLLDPLFGPTEALVSIPKSRVQGFEVQAIIRPFNGLSVDASVTYVDAEIQRFFGVGGLANVSDFSGTKFPFAPKWQSVVDAEYAFPLGRLKGFTGGTFTYNSRANSGIGTPNILSIDSFALLDLRAGVESFDKRYRLSVFGRNVTGKYHWGNTFLSFETIVRFPARPSTYGIALSYRFN